MSLTEQMQQIELGMSNFDYLIDEGLEDALKAENVCAQHSAWNFCGYVWFDAGAFKEEVWTYGSPSDTIYSAETLQELMDEVNSIYGGE